MNETTQPARALRADMNGDGQFTLSDVPALLLELFFLPGDWLIWTLATYAGPVAGFLDLDAGDYGGPLSVALSAVVWIVLALCVIWVCETVRVLDRALTEFVVRAFREARRRVRIGATLFVYRARRLLPRRQAARPDPVMSQELRISDQELLALRLHLDVRPGYALAVSEVAAALSLGRSDTRKLLDRLLGLELINTTLGGCEGESAYTLAPAGRVFLSTVRSHRVSVRRSASA